MEFKNLTYLLLQLAFLVIPVILSTHKKIRFAFQLRYLLPAIVFSGAIFVMWNMRFNELLIWTYNPKYITGILLAQVPLEEWISFLIIPLSSVYIHEYLKIRLEKLDTQNIFVALSLLLFIGTGILAYVFRRNIFSFFTFFLTAIYLGYTVFRNRFKKYYTAFYGSFVVTLLPFFVVSVIALHLPVISYNTDHIMGIELLSVPIERFFYVFLMLLINTTIYEYLSERRYY
jgi:lycopene cyclase domain-containing protein